MTDTPQTDQPTEINHHWEPTSCHYAYCPHIAQASDTARPVESPDQAAQIVALREALERIHEWHGPMPDEQPDALGDPEMLCRCGRALRDTAQAAAEAVAEIEEQAVHEFAAMLLAHPAITNLLAYGASPPEYPDLALVPKSDLDAFRALLSVSQEGGGA